MKLRDRVMFSEEYFKRMGPRGMSRHKVDPRERVGTIVGKAKEPGGDGLPCWIVDWDGNSKATRHTISESLLRVVES